MRERMDLNRGWEFTGRFSDAFAAGLACEIETVDLPHTCAETPFHYFDDAIYQMVCGYRRTLEIPADWDGREIVLCVGAAGHRAEVYLNGEKLFEHRCGYTAFEVPLPVRAGNTARIAILVDSRETLDQPPFGYVIDYMTYGGLYREVRLEARETRHIADVFLRPSLPAGAPILNGKERRSAIAKKRFDCSLGSDLTLAGDCAGLTVRQTVRDADGAVVAKQDFPAGETLSLAVPGAALWDIESPALYTVETALLDGETVLDAHTARTGFRQTEFRADGFYLNGRKVFLRGLNRHQCWPYIGYAAPERLQRQDAEICKRELGLNAVRTSHYPQSHHFVDRCDELGLLVFTEAPGWQHIGGDAWQAQHLKNVEDMVLQYRNHPSIFLWGVRINESRDNDALYAEANAIAHRLDPTRATGGVRCYKKGSFLEDVYTYNDFSHEGGNRGCEPKKAVTPDVSRAYLISEFNGHMFPTKPFDSEEHRLDHALRHANVLDAAVAEKDIAGAFGWCLFDYNTHRDFGSGDRICWHGVTDMFRNKKLAADVYSVWQDETPVLNVSSSMDIGEHPAGNRGRIFLFTNADEVRMYQNGVFIRSYSQKDSPWKHLRRGPMELTDYIGDRVRDGEDFSPVQAKLVKDMLNHSARFGSKMPPAVMAKAAVAMARYGMTFDDAYRLYGKYIGNWGGAATVYRFEAVKDGKVVAVVERGPAEGRVLRAEATSTALKEGATYDAALVRIRMEDTRGNTLPFFGEAVSFETEGPIRLLGPKQTVLRGGMGGTLVRTTGKPGEATLTIRADGAEPVKIAFTVE